MADGVGSGPRTVVLVSGAGSNLQALIDATRAARVPACLVGVLSDRPAVGALERAAQAGIPATVVEHRDRDRRDFDAALAAALAGFRPQLVVLAGFMRILATPLVETYAGRMLNVHPSLLPRFPGLHTHRRALAAGDREHGATVHFVVPELDAGAAILQYRVRVAADDTELTLRTRVQRGEHRIYPQALAWLAAGRLTLQDGKACLDGAPLPGPVVIDEAVCA
jgi:phosphoribosylglycinamide formyltransferase-1